MALQCILYALYVRNLKGGEESPISVKTIHFYKRIRVIRNVILKLIIKSHVF